MCVVGACVVPGDPLCSGPTDAALIAKAATMVVLVVVTNEPCRSATENSDGTRFACRFQVLRPFFQVFQLDQLHHTHAQLTPDAVQEVIT